jgi:hypothetical protein
MGLSQTNGNLYEAVITAYGAITTLFIIMPDFKPDLPQMGYGWCFMSFLKTILNPSKESFWEKSRTKLFITTLKSCHANFKTF